MKPIFKAFLVISVVVTGCASSKVSVSQPAERMISRQEYIDRYKDEAIREMLLSGVPASITLAQGMLESDNGNSPLARYANNHFGIKCHTDWEGPTFIQDDDKRNECFRKYYSVYNSFKDHSEFLSTRKRYASLFNLKTTDYKGWAKGLKKAGYATNPKYANLLIKIIEANELDQFDKIVKMPEVEYKKPKEKPAKKEAIANKNKVVVKVHENRIKYTYAREGDTFEKIAKRHVMSEWQITKYNEFSSNYQLRAGEIIYLQPKRRKSKYTASHTTEKNETLHIISQKYGVKTKHLLRYNDLNTGIHDPLQSGIKIYLRKK